MSFVFIVVLARVIGVPPPTAEFTPVLIPNLFWDCVPIRPLLDGELATVELWTPKVAIFCAAAVATTAADFLTVAEDLFAVFFTGVLLI